MAKNKKEGDVFTDPVMQAPEGELQETSQPEAVQEPLSPYDKVLLTFADGKTEECFYVSQGIYSKPNSAGKPFKVGAPREGVVLVEKIA